MHHRGNVSTDTQAIYVTSVLLDADKMDDRYWMSLASDTPTTHVTNPRGSAEHLRGSGWIRGERGEQFRPAPTSDVVQMMERPARRI